METRPNDQAFPLFTPPTFDQDGMGVYDPWKDSGLSKRELFAAMAMQGFCSVPGSIATADEISNWAVEQADALIEALNKEEGPADA